MTIHFRSGDLVTIKSSYSVWADNNSDKESIVLGVEDGNLILESGKTTAEIFEPVRPTRVEQVCRLDPTCEMNNRPCSFWGDKFDALVKITIVACNGEVITNFDKAYQEERGWYPERFIVVAPEFIEQEANIVWGDSVDIVKSEWGEPPKMEAVGTMGRGDFPNTPIRITFRREEMKADCPLEESWHEEDIPVNVEVPNHLSESRVREIVNEIVDKREPRQNEFPWKDHRPGDMVWDRLTGAGPYVVVQTGEEGKHEIGITRLYCGGGPLKNSKEISIQGYSTGLSDALTRIPPEIKAETLTEIQEKTSTSISIKNYLLVGAVSAISSGTTALCYSWLF